MVLSVSEQMHQRKQQKFRRELQRNLSRFTAAELTSYLDQTFSMYANRPSADDFVEMVMATKFGVSNSISEGGVGFLLEASLGVFNQLIESHALAERHLQPWGSYHIGRTDISPIWNVSFLFEIDEKLYPHASRVELDDLVWADDVSPYLFLDKSTQAFGYVIVPLPAMITEEFISYGEPHIKDWDYQVRRNFDRGKTARLRLFDFDSGQMEYISGVLVIFGTVDKLVLSLPDLAKHPVASHPRTLPSGKTTTVKAHKRRNPLRLVVNNRSLTDHIVYSVRDSGGTIRYFGEGKRDRWKHVNSGASHNWKINEHYFTQGPLEVEVLKEGLTKSEALSIEKMLIRRHSATALWNVKDYEPFASEQEKTISDEEIQGFL